MEEMSIHIGALESATKTVPVTFTLGEIEHKRRVNAVIKPNGTHDRAATVARVDEVARGVAEKIRIGIVTATPSPSIAQPPAE